MKYGEQVRVACVRDDHITGCPYFGWIGTTGNTYDDGTVEFIANTPDRDVLEFNESELKIVHHDQQHRPKGNRHAARKPLEPTSGSDVGSSH